MTESHNKIKQLVKHFREQEAAYLSPGYQESQVRQDFIDKFFATLGWDVTHEIQKNPYQQEVKIENKVYDFAVGKVNTYGSQRRADYAFFIAPNFRDVKFFVEAKKPSRNLANPNDYYQTIRYGWNSKTPIAVLTDFEEFHILDCRFKPDIRTALERKIEVFHYTDFEDKEKFKRIFYLFNRDEVANGSIDKFAAALPKPRAKAAAKGMFKAEYKPVDEAFLESLDGYREQLARAFKNKNQNLEGEELTEAVQRTIDRLVFIRFLEDKSIEEPAIAAIKDKPAVWEAFASLCKRLEPKYNGLVFKPHRIIDSPDFIPPDSKMFAEICSELADPTSPYDFDKIPISILGSIYERFLGKVVSTTEKRAKVIEKPEVRKAGGVYYTPEYIVRYIVTETVGKLIEGRTPEDISKMTFADIACGSGSFLIEVYNQLLDYHTKYYNEFPEKAKKGDVETREGKIVLSLKKRQEILTNNIYGVDIDFQATEVTQLSLYLKLLEDVTMNDAFQYSLLKEKILPDLKNNIVCGNSLIGTDILEGKLFDSEEERKLNPMNFEDVFPHIFSPLERGQRGVSGGGFDAIVGNPPYIKIQNITENNPLLGKLLKENYESTGTGNYDIYVVFLERGSKLLNTKGCLGYILPHKFFNQGYGKGIRQYLSNNGLVERVVHFGDTQIFKGASTYTCIFFLSKNKKEEIEVAVLPKDLEPSTFLQKVDFIKMNPKKWSDNDWYIINERGNEILEKLLQNNILEKITTNIFQGPKAGADNVFILKLIESGKTFSKCHSYSLNEVVTLETAILRKYVKGKYIRKYEIGFSENEVTIFPYDNDAKLFTIEDLKISFPKTLIYLNNPINKSILLKREEGRFSEQWWSYSRPQNMKIIFEKKILTPFNAFSNSFALDTNKDFVFSAGVSGAYGILLKPDVEIKYEYLLGILNSKTIFFIIKNVATCLRGSFYSFENKYLRNLPIPSINFSNPKEKVRHDNIVKLVEQMLIAKEKLNKAKLDSEVNKLEMQIASLDRQIDAAVYELYGLTEEEIRIVEGK